MVVSHSVRVGGYDLDEAIVKLLQDRERLLIGQEQAEAVKLEIGTAIAAGADIAVTTQVAGRDLGTGLLRRASIDADAVSAALQRPLAQIIEGIDLVLERTPPQLASDIADRGMMLVGGGALLPGFDELLRTRTGLAVTTTDDPLVTVARGAGAALEELSRLPARRRAARRGRRR